MRSIGCIIAFLIITLQLSIQGSSSSQNPREASDVVREQLRGLKIVDLIVYVDSLNISNSAAIESRIEKAAKRMLSKAGILLGKEQGAWLSIDVEGYPVDLQDHLIVQVWTKLYEEAALKRAPTLRNPHGYITWDTNWADLVRKQDIETFALKEAKDQLDEFCLDWETARDWAKIRSLPDITSSKNIVN